MDFINVCMCDFETLLKKLKLFMFDSHSRNAAGKIEDCGYSILLSFSDIGNFIEYCVPLILP